jgi:hypothetical protein
LAAAAAVFLAAGAFAAPVEVPVIDAPVGTGSVGAAPAAGGAALAPVLAAPLPSAPATGLAPAPVLAPAALSPEAAAPVAAAAAPVPAAAVRAAPGAFGRRAAPSAPGGFGRRTAPPGAASAPQAPAAGPRADEADWARGSALFDLAASRGDDLPAAAPAAGIPAGPTGRVLTALRRAGARGEAGPGRIPGMAGATWEGGTGRGYSGETSRLSIGGKPWYLKRLGRSPDPVIDATPPETRARNETGAAAVLRADPLLSRSFEVSPRVEVFRDGDGVYVLSEGLPAVGDGESARRDLTPTQRADAAIAQLVLGLGDMHGADVLPLGGRRFGLIDFEKLSRAPLETATPQEIDSEVMLKNFPLVDRVSFNDPAVYAARFREWLADYRAGGRARMDGALAGAGWSRAERETYLAAVDRNARTFDARLEPYLSYANGFYERMLKARADAARAPPPKKGLFGGLFGR